MRRTIATMAVAGFIAAAGFGLAAPSASAGCLYQGENNALPTGGLPVLPYANATTAPSALAGIGDGTSSNYAQVTFGGTTAQVEANSALAGQSMWIDSNGNMGSC